jgi:oxygen-independent coproporphyrinogen-3 oxidase
VPDAELLKRYNQTAPRYTSYPPIPHWGPADEHLLLNALQRSSAPLSIYLHIPFCERLCLYCGCNTVISRNHSVTNPYLQRLIAEMDIAEASHGRKVTQIHWGGGTPTYLDSDQLTRLYNALSHRFDIARNAEVSIEIDPRVTTPTHLETVRGLGFNRLSMGIQDFDENVQRAVRRIQSFESTRALFALAHALKFESISADLIYGLPLQTASSFARTLNSMLELRPDRLSVFSYAHVPSVKRQQKAFEPLLPNETEKARLFDDAVRVLTAAGYEHIGMDHFALPDDPLVQARNNGTLHRNFQGYTTHAETDLLGFGVSAIGHVGDTFVQNYRDLKTYAAAIDNGHLPVCRGYEQSRDDKLRGAVIESWLCNGFISKQEIEDDFGINFDEYFESQFDQLRTFEADGLIQGAVSRIIRSTPTGRLFMRTVAKAFDAFQTVGAAARAV